HVKVRFAKAKSYMQDSCLRARRDHAAHSLLLRRPTAGFSTRNAIWHFDMGRYNLFVRDKCSHSLSAGLTAASLRRAAQALSALRATADPRLEAPRLWRHQWRGGLRRVCKSSLGRPQCVRPSQWAEVRWLQPPVCSFEGD